jgi:hypothetical protein
MLQMFASGGQWRWWHELVFHHQQVSWLAAGASRGALAVDDATSHMDLGWSLVVHEGWLDAYCRRLVDERYCQRHL